MTAAAMQRRGVHRTGVWKKKMKTKMRKKKEKKKKKEEGVSADAR